MITTTHEDINFSPASTVRNYRSTVRWRGVTYIQIDNPRGSNWVQEAVYSPASSQTLAETLGFGNATGGNDILISTASGDSITYVNAAQTRSISLVANPVLGNFTQTFQDKSGTIALLSDITATLYNGNGTVGAGRVATLTDYIAFNGGEFRTENGYWQGTAKILYINPNGTTANLFVGQSSGNNTMTGTDNTGLGLNTLLANTSGNYNNAIGRQCLSANTTGSANNAMGYYALANNTTGSDNTAQGGGALESNTVGSNNTALGRSALFSNTTGFENVAVGLYSLFQNNNNYNTAIGTFSGQNATGTQNVYIGTYSATNATTGDQNVAVGYNTLYSNTGTGLTAIGWASSASNSTGIGNVSVGYAALFLNTTGSGNIALGYNAGSYNVTDSNQLFIHNGLGVTDLATGKSNSLIYGIFDAAVANQRLNINASVGIGGGVANGTSVLNIANLPTSAVGLVTGDIWNNLGVLTIV